MAIKVKPFDVVLVGMGWTGSVLAKELTQIVLKVVGLKRGRMRNTVPDLQSPGMHDELKCAVRYVLMQDTARETVAFRNRVDQEALPMRQLDSFLPGTDVGGAGVHWNGLTGRFLSTDFRMRSHHEERYGKNFILPELTIQDWGVTYEEREPHYDRFEYRGGVGGKAGNLKPQIQAGGRPFEGLRSRDHPNPPMKTACARALFIQAAHELGYSRFPVPSSNMTRANWPSTVAVADAGGEPLLLERLEGVQAAGAYLAPGKARTVSAACISEESKQQDRQIVAAAVAALGKAPAR